MQRELGYGVAFTRHERKSTKISRHVLKAPFHAVNIYLAILGGIGRREAIVHLLALDPAVKKIVESSYSNDPAWQTI
jgi:hypothetical protein